MEMTFQLAAARSALGVVGANVSYYSTGRNEKILPAAEDEDHRARDVVRG